MVETIRAQRSSMNDARCVDRLIVFSLLTVSLWLSLGLSLPARARQCHVKVIQIVPGTLLGRPGTAKSTRTDLGNVSGASRERLGESSVRPESAQGVHKGAQERQRERPGASGSTPKRPKSIPRHVWKRKNRVFPVQHDREAFSMRLFVDFRRLPAFSERQRTL